MNNLQIKNNTIDSREVAQMVGKQHNDLLKDIRTYIGYLGEGKIPQSDFFIEGTYMSIQNKEFPNYQVTKKGCEFIAHKLTGQKGTVFTAKYINKFHEMEQSVIQAQPTSIEDVLILSLQEMKNVKLKLEQQDKAIEEANNKINDIREALTADTHNWRKWVNDSINKLAQSEIIIEELGDLRYQKVRINTYKELETKAGCDLKTRIKKLKERLVKAGATKKQITETSYLDVIEQDKKLKEIYTAILKNVLIKYQGVA